MVQKRRRQADRPNRRPFYTMLALIAAMLVILCVSVGFHLSADQAAQEEAQQQAAQQEQTTQQETQTPQRQLKQVAKAKTRKQLAKLAGKGAKGRTLSVIGSSYSLEGERAAKLEKRIKALEKRHRVSFVMLDLKTGEGIAYDPARKYYCASAIKGPYVVALNKWRKGSVNSSVRELMTEAIEVSDNKSYESLHTSFGSGVTRKMMRYSGATSFEPEYSYGYGSARDFARFWISSYWYFFEDTNGNSKWCRNLFDSVNESFIHQALKSECKTYSKAGWFPGEEFDNVHNDAGIVMAEVGGESRPYVLAVMSTAYGSEKQLRSLVKAIDAVHEDMMYE